MSFYFTEDVRVDEIICHWRQWNIQCPMPSLLMSLRHRGPDHQNTWYWCSLVGNLWAKITFLGDFHKRDHNSYLILIMVNHVMTWRFMNSNIHLQINGLMSANLLSFIYNQPSAYSMRLLGNPTAALVENISIQASKIQIPLKIPAPIEFGWQFRKPCIHL